MCRSDAHRQLRQAVQLVCSSQLEPGLLESFRSCSSDVHPDRGSFPLRGVTRQVTFRGMGAAWAVLSAVIAAAVSARGYQKGSLTAAGARLCPEDLEVALFVATRQQRQVLGAGIVMCSALRHLVRAAMYSRAGDAVGHTLDLYTLPVHLVLDEILDLRNHYSKTALRLTPDHLTLGCPW